MNSIGASRAFGPAKALLDKLIAEAPFKVTGIQVDGGSEFRASYDLPHRIEKLQPLVDAFARRFNTVRPRQALDGMAPAEYPANVSTQTSPSHMS